MISRLGFKAPQYFIGLITINFLLLRELIGLRLRIKGLRYKSLGTSTILRFTNILYLTSLLASLRLTRSPLYIFHYLILLYFDSGTLILVILDTLSLSTRAPTRVGAARLDQQQVVRVLVLSIVVGYRVLLQRRAEIAF